jgi:hypothetical protein
MNDMEGANCSGPFYKEPYWVTRSMVDAIRDRHKAGETLPELADDYRLPITLVRKIVKVTKERITRP